MASKTTGFLAELKRRKVYHVAATYVVVAVGTIGFADAALGESWERIRLVVLVLFLAGLPLALVLAWAHEVRTEKTKYPGSSTQGVKDPFHPEGT